MDQGGLRPTVEQWMREAWESPELVVDEIGPPAHASDELAADWRSAKYPVGTGGELEGVIPLDVVLRATPGGTPQTTAVLLKARTAAGLGRTALPGWLEAAGVQLSRPLDSFGSAVEFLDSREREIAAYRLQLDADPFSRYMPRRLGDRVDPGRDEYLLLVERVDGAVLMDSGENVAAWTRERVETMVDAAAALHAVWLGRTHELEHGPWPTAGKRAAAVIGDRELWQQLIDTGRRHFPGLVGAALHSTCSELVETLDDWYPPRDQLPQTLVHDDLNPRNACFRADGRPLIYDWELTMVDIPQRDLVELLTFTFDPADTSRLDLAAVAELVERHRGGLEARSGMELDQAAWWAGFRIALRLEAISRVPYQWLFGTAIELSYIPRITAAIHELLRAYA
jgi:hydroxymethylglutaryl-CoA reductase (NADPH)